MPSGERKAQAAIQRISPETEPPQLRRTAFGDHDQHSLHLSANALRGFKAATSVQMLSSSRSAASMALR
ncbi:hypothetical protein E4U17_000848, partial [Claviceps sp. LM77 group G4]